MFRSALLSDSDFDDDCPTCRGAGAPCVCNPRGAALWAMVYSDALRVAEAMGGADEPVH
jgi:hypothetical protein